MSDSFTWQINSLNRYLSDGTVYCVNWDLIGIRETEEGSSYRAVLSGSTGLGPKDPDHFLPYDSLTKEDVVNWLEATLTQPLINEYQAVLVEELDSKQYPTTAQGVPWTPIPTAPIDNRPPYPGEINGVKHVWDESLNTWILDPNHVDTVS